jgi:hypothetical protein
MFEARRAGAEIELLSGKRPEGLRDMRAVAEEAKNAGFNRIAAEAQKFSQRSEPRPRI